MSASLVGSEMCIRDSSWSAASRSRGCTSGLLPCTSPTAGVAGAGVASVSYTHLTLPTICSV
eukprot:8974838-Alexandrium_andersonii.AAC.1